MKVLAQRCDECLFSKSKIVSDERRKEILQKLDLDDSWFICHKATLAGRDDVMCRGFYDANPDCFSARLTKALGIPVNFVEEKNL